MENFVKRYCGICISIFLSFPEFRPYFSFFLGVKEKGVQIFIFYQYFVFQFNAHTKKMRNQNCKQSIKRQTSVPLWLFSCMMMRGEGRAESRGNEFFENFWWRVGLLKKVELFPSVDRLQWKILKIDLWDVCNERGGYKDHQKK